MPDTTLTIVFRGLMVMHKAPDHVQLGILPAPGHFPRITTITNSVFVKTFDLNNPEQPSIDPDRPIWRLDVDSPSGITFLTTGETFDRKTHEDPKDFRWSSDLEGTEFYNEDLTTRLNTGQLLPVVKIFNGSFYTRLKTPPLLRSQGANAAEEFGCIAAVTGCDIVLNGNNARLIEEGSDRVLFTFTNEPDTIYEFANTPPDIEPHPGHHHEDPVPADHFQLYYELFSDLTGIEKFGFRADEAGALGPPAPHPALCGIVRLGKRTGSLR